MRVETRLLTGDFNHMSQHRQPDSSVLVTLTKRGDPHIYEMVVFDLYGPLQRVISEVITDASQR